MCGFFLRRTLSPRLFTLVASALASPSAADGIFFQHDAAEGRFVTTFILQRDRTTFGMNAFSDEEDRSLAFSVARSIELPPDYGKIRFGPTIRQGYKEGSGKSTDIGAKIVYEKYVSADFGAYFWLADANTIDNALLLLGQASFSQTNLILEVSYGRSDDFSDTSVTLSKQLSNRGFSGRVGYRLEELEFFVGFSFNTF